MKEAWLELLFGILLLDSLDSLLEYSNSSKALRLPPLLAL